MLTYLGPQYIGIVWSLSTYQHIFFFEETKAFYQSLEQTNQNLAMDPLLLDIEI